MAQNPITVPLPANLPENWQNSQIISANGTEAGLTQQYGYNYLMQQVNAAQQAATEIGEAFAGLADTSLSNLDTPQEALYNLGAGVKPNLLKNAYFVGGGSQQGGEQFPINQQGQTIYNSSGNIFDGWKIVGSGLSVSLEPDGISLVWSASGVLWQTFNNLSYFSGKTVTMSALVSQVNIGTTNNIILRCRVNGSWGSGTTGIKITQSGLATFTFTLPESIQSLSFEIGADSGSCKCYAAKLEEGTEQTLAYQDEGGTWQLLPQPDSDYTTQLLKCQFPGPTGVQDAITEAVSEHNTSDEAHEDIRTAIDGKANVNHAWSTTRYGAASDGYFGHVKVTPGNGLAIAGGVVNMGAASGSAAGAVTTGEQTFAGDKTFSGEVNVANPAPTVQAVRNMYAGTDDMEAGTTELTTGLIYLMYE